MENALILFTRLSSMFLIALVGYFIAKRKMLNKDQRSGLSLLLNRISLPALIIVSIARMQLSSDMLINSLYVLIGYCIVYFINYFIFAFIAKKEKMEHFERSVFLNGGIHGNVAFLGFPLLIAVFGEAGLFYGTIYFMYDNVSMSSIGMTRFKREYDKESSLAPVTIALIIGVILMIIQNLLPIDILNNPIINATSDIGSLTTPIAFLFVGMIVNDYKIKDLIKNTNALKIILLKMIVVPIVLMFAFTLVQSVVPLVIIKVVIVLAMTPPFASLLSMANEYQKDMDMASSAVVLGHICSIVTIPILFMILNLIYT